MLQFLTNRQRSNLQDWTYSVDDQSLTGKWLTNYWKTTVQWIPDYVAPNVLSLSGLILVMYSYHITNVYYDMYPRVISLLSALFIFGYHTLDSIDGMHARNTKNASPLGELFDHMCDSIATLFITLTLAKTMGINDISTLYYLTQGTMMLFMLEHLHAFRTNTVYFGPFTGPGEILLITIMSLLWITATGNSFISGSTITPILFYVYWIIYIHSIVKISFNQSIFEWMISENKWNFKNQFWTSDSSRYYGTKIGLLLCLSMRHVNGILLFSKLINNYQYIDIVVNGLTLSVVISDLIVSKMAKRDLHPMIVIGIMISSFDYKPLTFVLIISYFCKIFYEICESSGLFLFTPVTTVYISGVWDLLHLGHMKHFQEVTKLGNRLIVGVHSDIEVASYKRTPTLTMEERIATAQLCKGVSAVIPNAPLIITEDFIKKHNIHIVGCSAEYDSPNDKYYEIPRKLGILKVIQRVEGISTSDLMKRVANRVDNDVVNNTPSVSGLVSLPPPLLPQLTKTKGQLDLKKNI
jgi:cytidyltransferase-like protein